MKPQFKLIKLVTSISLIVGFNLQPIFQNRVNSKEEEIFKSTAKRTLEKKLIKYRRKNKTGSKNNPYLKDGYIMLIGQSFISSSSEVIKEISDTYLGIYSKFSIIEALGG